MAIGLQVERNTKFGHVTPRLSARRRSEYADLLAELEQGLVLVREPRPTRTDRDNKVGKSGVPSETDGPPANSSKYVFASCRCQAGRGRAVTIRVATGSWQPGVIGCDACGEKFEES